MAAQSANGKKIILCAGFFALNEYILLVLRVYFYCYLIITRAAPDSPTYKWRTNVIDDTTSLYNALRDRTNR